MSKGVVPWLSWWVALLFLWTLLISKLSQAELVAGVVVCAIAATAAEWMRRQSPHRFRGRKGWLPLAHDLPGRIISDSALLGLALWRYLAARDRQMSGAFQWVPAPTAVGSDAALLRALCVVLISLAPNTFVIGFDRRQQSMLIHQLLRRKLPVPGLENSGERR